MLSLRRKIGIILAAGSIGIILVIALKSQYHWEAIGNEFTIIIEIMVGAIIAIIATSRSEQEAQNLSGLIGKVNEYEEKQKQFLDKLESTKNARIYYYGNRLLTDFAHVKDYYSNIENLPKDKLQKLSAEFFAQFYAIHAIYLRFDSQKIEIPGNEYFEVMRENLQVIESDLTPDISNHVKHAIELARWTLIPFVQNIAIHTEQWQRSKDNLDEAVKRLESIIDRKPVGKDDIQLVRRFAEVSL